MKKARAIELLKNFNQYDEPNCVGYWDCDECVEALYMAIEALEHEPKRGYWTNEAGKPNDEQYSLYCSECKAWSEYRDRYCPNCGARMESEENGNG